MNAPNDYLYSAPSFSSPEAEIAILGSLLLDNSTWDRVGNELQPVHFASEVNRMVFTEIGSQINAAKGCDVVTVFEALDGQVELTHLNAMAQYVPSAANARRYADTIVDRFKSRQLMAVSSEISDLAQDNGRAIAERVEVAQGLLVKLIDHTSNDDWLDVEQSMVTALDTLQARADGVTNAMPTSLADLDSVLEGGLRPGELVIVGARPSMGKTALAICIGLHMAKDYAVGMFSMEMPHAELDDRMIAVIGQVSLSHLKRPSHGRGLQWDRVSEAVERLRHLNFYKSDQSGLTINQVRSKARALKRTRGLNVLIVDYIGLMNGTDQRQPRAYQLEEISRGLKSLAKELGIAVICLAQVNRKVEERADATPNLSDLRDSGAIEQDADVVMFVHRPIQSRPDMGDEWQHYAKVSVAKNRNGRCGTLHLSYFGEQTRFGNWSGPAPTTRTRSTSAAQRGMPEDY